MTTTSKHKLPEGFVCGECGEAHRYSSYVYAHWHTPLTHTCACGAKHLIRGGVVTRIKDERKRNP